MTYKIGYRRPPLSTRFKKGESGNPRGRPKGSTSFVTLLEKELGQSIVVNENGKRTTITRLQAMIKRIVAGALQGEQKALLTLVEILRRTGRFQPSEAEDDQVPEDYEAIIEAYVASRRKAATKTSTSKTTGRKAR
jgi:hypothetical protein